MSEPRSPGTEADEIRWHHHGDCPHNGEREAAGSLDVEDMWEAWVDSAPEVEDGQHMVRLTAAVNARFAARLAPARNGAGPIRLYPPEAPFVRPGLVRDPDEPG